MGRDSASAKMIDKVEECICKKFNKPELVNPSRIERRCGIDHNQAHAALQSIAPHPGKPGHWKICEGKHDLIRTTAYKPEWWYACNYSETTHKSKYFEERILEDFGIQIPPISEICKFIDNFDSILQNFDKALKSLDYRFTLHKIDCNR